MDLSPYFGTLFRVVTSGDKDKLERLLKTREIDAYLENKDGTTALMVAANEGHADCIKCLVDANKTANINKEDVTGNTALILASKGGHYECVKYLVETGLTDVNLCNLEGTTALMLTAKNGHTECVKCLIDTRLSDVNICDGRGNSALMLAAEKRHFEIVKLLCGVEGIDVNIRENLFGRTALMFAISISCTESVKCLIETGLADISICDQRGNTALMYASDRGCTESLRCLIETGLTDVNLCDLKGKTALMLAAEKGHYEIVKILSGVEEIAFDIRDNSFGMTALMLALEMGHTESAKCLIDTGLTDVNLCDKDGYTALMLAAKRGYYEIVNTLTRIDGIAVNFSDYLSGRTALMFASDRGCAECVRYLIDTGRADVNLCDSRNLTALLLAAYGGHSKCVGILLSSDKTEVNGCDDKGQTALMQASFNGHVKCVKALISRDRTEVNKYDHKGRTALMHAIFRCELECVKCIISDKNVEVWKRDNEGKTAFMLAAAIPDVRYLRCFLDIIITESTGSGREQDQRDEVFTTEFSPHSSEVYTRYLPGIAWRIPYIYERDQNEESVVNLFIRNGHGRCLTCFLLAYRYSPICENHLWSHSLPENTETSNYDYDNDGQSALMIAEKCGNKECLEYLLQFERIRFHFLVVMMQKELCESGTISSVLQKRLFSIIRNHDNMDIFMCMMRTGGNIGTCVDNLLSAFICGTNSSGSSALLNALQKYGNKNLLKLLIQHVSDKTVLLDSIESFRQKSGRMSSHNFRTVSALAQCDFFIWKWYPESCTHGIGNANSLTRELVTRDIAPESFEWQGKQASPLYYAFTSHNDHGLVRYLMANLFMTPRDLKYFQNDKVKRECLRQIESEDKQRIYREHFEAPWRLEALSLLSLSIWMRKNKEQKDVCKILDVAPEIFRSRLPFRNPMRMMCQRQWKMINIDFLNHRLLAPQRDHEFTRTRCCESGCLQFIITPH